MYSGFQLKINDRIIIDSEGVKSKVEGSTLHFRLENSDAFPNVVDSELVAIGGWKLNAFSLIHSKASPDMVVRGWKSLEQLVPMDRLLIPFLYSNAIDYVRFNMYRVEPKWTKLLRLCYWYERCLGLNDKDFHYKQTEIKRAILRPLRNAEKTINNNKIEDFLSAMEQLSRVISSYTSELIFPTLTEEFGNRVSFGKKHDFLFNSLPCEVKSLYSHMTIKRKKDGTPKLDIHGQILGEEVKPYEDLFRFILSKKALAHMYNAFSQGGKFVFLDITHTFASILMYLFSEEKGIDLSFPKALNSAVSLLKDTKEKLPVVVVSSVCSYEHQMIAFVVPMPLQLFQWIENMIKNNESLSHAIERALTKLKESYEA